MRTRVTDYDSFNESRDRVLSGEESRSSSGLKVHESPEWMPIGEQVRRGIVESG